jgi:hypothetical protein
MGGWKKQMPCCNGRDTGFYQTRKGADFHLVFYYEKLTIKFLTHESK